MDGRLHRRHEATPVQQSVLGRLLCVAFIRICHCCELLEHKRGHLRTGTSEHFILLFCFVVVD